MTLKFHTCGQPVIERTEFDGVGYVTDYCSVDTAREITHCDRCGRALWHAAVDGELRDRAPQNPSSPTTSRLGSLEKIHRCGRPWRYRKGV